MSEKLKPCAHCGRPEPIIGNERDGASVCCANLKCLARVLAFNPDSRAKAIAAWNRRAGATQ